MSNRTTEAYKSVYSYIHKNILPLDAKGIITDFETALRNGLKYVVPETRLLGCWFHHCQCLRRKVASDSKLFDLIRKEKAAWAYYRKFQCLALLPATRIKSAFDQLAFEALTKYPEFKSFVEYYDHQWLQIETPDNYSLFLEVNRFFTYSNIENSLQMLFENTLLNAILTMNCLAIFLDTTLISFHEHHLYISDLF